MAEPYDKVLLLGSIRSKDVCFVDYGELIISKEDEFKNPQAYTFRTPDGKIQLFDIPKERVMLGDTWLIGGSMLISPKKVLVIRHGIGNTSIDNDIKMDIAKEVGYLKLQNERLTSLLGRSIRLIKKSKIERLEVEMKKEVLDFVKEARRTVRTPSTPSLRVVRPKQKDSSQTTR